MIYTIPTDYCYDRHGDRWGWNGTTCCWEKRGEGNLWEEYSAINLLAQARGPLTNTPPITVGTVLDTAEKYDTFPPLTVAHWPGMLSSAIKTWGGKWIRTGSEGTFTSETFASAFAPYTVIYVPEETSEDNGSH